MFSTLASVTGAIHCCRALQPIAVVFISAELHPHPSFSNMARGGVVLYVAIQRALESGMLSLGNTRDLVAGANKALTTEVAWQQVLGQRMFSRPNIHYKAASITMVTN